MQDDWTEKLSCAIQCHRCDEKIDPKDPRILSVYDHQAICMACKKAEEQRPDYGEISKNTIGQCIIDTELQYSDPAGTVIITFIHTLADIQTLNHLLVLSSKQILPLFQHSIIPILSEAN